MKEKIIEKILGNSNPYHLKRSETKEKQVIS